MVDILTKLKIISIITVRMMVKLGLNKQNPKELRRYKGLLQNKGEQPQVQRQNRVVLKKLRPHPQKLRQKKE
jgi:hypothetical protein